MRNCLITMILQRNSWIIYAIFLQSGKKGKIMAKYPTHLLTLLAFLKKFPGVGTKTAERFAFQLLNWSETELKNFSTLLSEIKSKIIYCQQCGCFAEETGCFFCQNSQRDQKTLCIIASPKDVFPIEEMKMYFGLYHVLDGLLSPIDGKNPENLRILELKERAAAMQIQEVIIALDSTLEGDTTALYLKEELKKAGIKTTRLAFGLPLGSSLDFVDGGTLFRAFSGRQSF